MQVNVNKNLTKLHSKQLDFFSLFLEFVNNKHTIPENDQFWSHITNTNISSIPTSVLDIFVNKTFATDIKNNIKNNNLVHYFIFVHNLVNQTRESLIAKNECSLSFNQFHSILLLTRTYIYILSLHLSLIQLIYYLDYSKYYDEIVFSNSTGLNIRFQFECVSLDPCQINSDFDLYTVLLNTSQLSNKTKQLLLNGYCLIDSQYKPHSIKSANKLLTNNTDLTLLLVPFTLHENSLIKLLIDDFIEFIKLEDDSIGVIKSKNFMLEVINILSSLILDFSSIDQANASLDSLGISSVEHPYSGTALLLYDYLITQLESKLHGNNISQLLHKLDTPNFIIKTQSQNSEFLNHLSHQLSIYQKYKTDSSPIVSEYCKLLAFTLVNYSGENYNYRNNSIKGISLVPSNYFILLLLLLVQQNSIPATPEALNCLFNYLNQLLSDSQCKCWVVVDSAIAALVSIDKIISPAVITSKPQDYLDILLEWMVMNFEGVYNINLQICLAKVYLKLINAVMCDNLAKLIPNWTRLFNLYLKLNLDMENAIYDSDYDLILGWICIVFSIHVIIIHYIKIYSLLDKAMHNTLVKLIDKIADVYYDNITIPKEYNSLVDNEIIKKLYKELDLMLKKLKLNDINIALDCIDYSNINTNIDKIYFRPLIWSELLVLLNSKDAFLLIKENN